MVNFLFQARGKLHNQVMQDSSTQEDMGAMHDAHNGSRKISNLARNEANDLDSNAEASGYEWYHNEKHGSRATEKIHATTNWDCSVNAMALAFTTSCEKFIVGENAQVAKNHVTSVQLQILDNQ